MRKSNPKDDNGIILMEDKFLGFSFGFDFCAEHEIGIEELKNEFGIKTDINKFGIEKRQIKHLPEHLKFHDSGKRASLILSKHCDHNQLPRDLYIDKYRDKNTAFAWSNNKFGILVDKKEYREYLKELYEAFQIKDIAIFLGGRSNNPFFRSGLVIAIVSRTPEELRRLQYDTDKDDYELHRAFEKTKIKLKLKKAGKSFFALSPKWSNQNKKELKIWLNPYNQKKYNCGWFSLEELEQWANDSGPVLKHAN